MYCPMCGNKLEIYDVKKPEVEIDWNLKGSALDEAIKRSVEIENIKRMECTCSNGCFGIDYPLYFHHPFHGINSAPGDSWSLSWVK